MIIGKKGGERSSSNSRFFTNYRIHFSAYLTNFTLLFGFTYLFMRFYFNLYMSLLGKNIQLLYVEFN